MAWYRVRNNTRTPIGISTYDGFYKLESRATALLNLANPNTPRMRALQQGAQLSIVPDLNPATGKLSKKLPKLHLGSVNRYGPVPGGGTTPTVFLPSLSLGDPRNNLNLIALGLA